MLSMELSGAPRQLAGGGGESIFQLGIYKIDGTYWLVLVGMILFCTLVDRGQAVLHHFAEDSPANKVFLEKVETELLLFGAVAVTLFVVLQAASGISDKTVTMITFIDVQVSMGACSLIFIAFVTSILRKVYWHHWCSCEMAHATAEQKTAATSGVLPSCSKILDAMAATKSISRVELQAEHIFARFYCATTPETYSLMTAQFRKEHQVPNVFRYHLYLYAVMTRVCCNLMTIEWSSWLILAFAGSLGYIFDLIIVESGDGKRTFTGYIIGMLLIYWSLLLAHLVLYLAIKRSFKKLISHLARVGGVSAEGPVKVPIGDRWPDRAAWALQIIHLFNSFCLAFYIMHGIPNLKGESPLWTLAVLAPLLCNVFFLLPLTLPRLVCIDGFLAVDSDALELVFEELQQSEIDMRYLYDIWMLANTPSVSGWKSSLNMVEFQKYLGSLGLHLSGQRLKRLFRLMDSDISGTVEMSELQEHLDAMRKRDEASSERDTGLYDKKNAVCDTTQAAASVPSESIAEKVEQTTL